MAVEDSVAQDQIRAFVERIERMEEEKAALSSDIREIYAEAKGNGFDTKILRRVVGIRKQDANARMEQEALLELYMSALGMVPPPPSYDEERERLNSLASKVEAGLRKPKVEEAPDPVAQYRADPAMAIVDASNLKSKSEPQPTKAAGSDLAPRPQGQVADIQPETANEASDETGHVAAVAAGHGHVDADAETQPKGGENVDAPDVPATPKTEHASGKSVETSASAAPVKYPAPGIVTYENHPPEGVTRSAVSIAFANIGQDATLIKYEMENGKAQPIVKICKEILDGWARFMTARDMVELDGSPVTYAVVQYDGTDPLIDAIKLNVEGRVLGENQKRQIAATLTRQNPKRKDDIYRAFELWMEPA
jgi:uncharacterized protein (UPF0335 family)